MVLYDDRCSIEMSWFTVGILAWEYGGMGGEREQVKRREEREEVKRREEGEEVKRR